MKVVIYLGHSIGTRHRTGVQRVAIGLAWGLRALVPTDYVKWDAIDGQMRHLDAEDLAQVFGMDAPAPHRMSWRLNYRFSETIERPEETWFLYPEVSHHESGDDRLAAMVAQARDYGFRTAAIFYDIIPITNSDYQGARGQHVSYVSDLLRFDLLLPISRWSRDELLRFLQTDVGTNWSSSIASRLVPVLLPERSWDSVMAQSVEASDANTVLLVGAVEPRKQQVAVLRTFTLLQESGRISRDLRAEVYGGLHPHVNEAFHAELRRNSRIIHHSFSTDAAIAAAYNRSLFSVLASVDEGFGLPITESLAHGVPCLTASFGAMREVAEGGGCRLVDVRDPAALAEGIAELANDPSLRASLRAEIAARRLRGWEDYARDILARFAMVAEKEGKRVSAAGAAASPKGDGLLAFGEVGRPPGSVAGDGPRAPLLVARFDGTPSDAATLRRDVLDRMALADVWAVGEPEAGAALIAAAAISDVPKMLPGIVISGPKANLDTAIRATVEDLWRRDARLGAAALRECAARVLLQRHRAETAGLSEPLSIIVSTYNRGPFVEANAEWLLRITDLPGETIQVIVVDNASTDDTVERLERFRSHPRFTLRVNPQNVGMLGNLRVCASLAGSRHVWLTGDDDFIVPEALPVIREVLRDDPGLPLVSVNFAVYHRSRWAPQDRPELILKEGRPLATDVLPSGIYPLNQIATLHDNLFTAIYPLVLRTDLLRACFNFPFCGVPFGDLTESVPTTRYLLEACRYFKCYWHAPVGVVGNAHNSWSRHRPRWHAVLMPQVFELAREAGADPVKLQRFAGLQLTLYDEALGIASDTGERVPIAPCELGAAHRVFRTRPCLPEQPMTEGSTMRRFENPIRQFRIENPISIELTPEDLELQLFRGYSDADTAIIAEFARHDLKSQPGFIVDFLGVRTRATSLWPEARALAGNVIKVPIPGDFHCETIEWLGLLKSVKGARGKYVVMELGAGFGPWVVAGGTAARSRGIEQIQLYAVEGDPHHYQFLRQHLSDNGFEPDEHVLLEAAVGVEAGVAEWPVMEDSSAEWGSRPILADGDYLGRAFTSTKTINIVPIADLIRREEHWNLVHIDVQGHEVDICRSCLSDLNERVSWIVVGTHSRKLDGDLLELFCRADWELEHEKPTKFRYYRNPKTLEGMTIADGTQVWRNPRLTE